jgi:hypothetical protein
VLDDYELMSAFSRGGGGDPGFDYDGERDLRGAGDSLARCLVSLRGLEPLLRRGLLISVPSPEHLVSRGLGGGVGRELSLSDAVVYRNDPVLAWRVVQQLLDPANAWEVELQGLDVREDFSEVADFLLTRWEDKVASPEISHLPLVQPRGVTVEQLEHATQLHAILGVFTLSPVITDPYVAEHLSLACRLLSKDLAARVTPTEPIEGERMMVPSLAHLSLEDVVKVRLQEELFHSVRTALLKVQQVARQDATYDSDFNAYLGTVRSAAEDIVRPEVERLDKEIRRLGTRSMILGRGAGGLVSLLLSTAATLVGVPPPLSRTAGGGAGTATRGHVENKVRRGQDEAKTARSLLLALLDEK